MFYVTKHILYIVYDISDIYMYVCIYARRKYEHESTIRTNELTSKRVYEHTNSKEQIKQVNVIRFNIPIILSNFRNLLIHITPLFKLSESTFSSS